MLSVISGFEKNALERREVEGLHSEESGGKELSGKRSSLKLHPPERGGGLKDQNVYVTSIYTHYIILYCCAEFSQKLQKVVNRHC